MNEFSFIWKVAERGLASAWNFRVYISLNLLMGMSEFDDDEDEDGEYSRLVKRYTLISLLNNIWLYCCWFIFINGMLY